jgi:hypothetical protein
MAFDAGAIEATLTSTETLSLLASWPQKGKLKTSRESAIRLPSILRSISES